MEIKPGQIYERIKEGSIYAIILLSKEPNDSCWVVAEFQEYCLGAQIVKEIYDDDVIKKLKYLISLEEIIEIKKILDI